MPKEKSRSERYSRERSKDRERRKRSRSRDKDREKDRRRAERRRSRSRGRDERRRRSRSRESDRHRRSSRDRDRRREKSKSRESDTAAQQAQINQFLSASLSGLTGPSTVHSIAGHAFAQQQLLQDQGYRTDFSNLFNNNANASSAFAIAAAKAAQITSSKNLTDYMHNHNNGGISDSSRDGADFHGGSADNSASGAGDGKRKKKSRWATGNDNDKTFIPGMPTILPSTMTPDQQEAYLVQLQIEEISRKLRTGDLGISQNPEERSPSPEPIYSSDGKRLNTRDFRTRKKLEEQRHLLITRMQCMNPDFKPPADYKPPVTRVSDKVLIPQEEHPDINFVGLLIGPRGNTLKAMEKETGAKIIIRGKGSVKEGKVGRKDGQPLPGEDEPLHAFITASNPEHVKKAVDKIKEVITQGIEVPEGHNDLRRMQLRELAQLNGTLRETDCPRCTNCGSTEHKSWLCPDKPNVTNNIVCSACGGAGHIAKDCRSKRPGQQAIGNNQTKIDEEYLSLMAELGEVQPNTQENGNTHVPQQPTRAYSIFDRPREPPRPLMAPPQQQQHHQVPPPPPNMPQMPQLQQLMQGGPPAIPPWSQQQPPLMQNPPQPMMPWAPPPPPGTSAMPLPPGTDMPPYQSSIPPLMGNNWQNPQQNMMPPYNAWQNGYPEKVPWAGAQPPPPPPGVPGLSGFPDILAAPPPPPPS